MLDAKASTLWSLGQREAAADVFAGVLERGPSASVADVAGTLNLGLGRWNLARDYWERAARLTPIAGAIAWDLLS